MATVFLPFFFKRFKDKAYKHSRNIKIGEMIFNGIIFTDDVDVLMVCVISNIYFESFLKI